VPPLAQCHFLDRHRRDRGLASSARGDVPGGRGEHEPAAQARRAGAGRARTRGASGPDRMKYAAAPLSGTPASRSWSSLLASARKGNWPLS